MSLLSHEPTRTSERPNSRGFSFFRLRAREGATHLKRRRGTRFPQLYSPPNSSLPRFRELSSEGHETSRTCRVIRPRRFVASLKLCLGLRIAAGRTSGRAWDFSWQFVVSELPGKKEEQCSGRELHRSRVIYSRFPPRTMKLAHA